MTRYELVLMVWSTCFLVAAAPAKLGARSFQQDGDTNAASEVWGGQDVRLLLDAHGAIVEFDCAEGEILQPISANASGEFTARGTYTPGQFGPIRENSSPGKIPATYKGEISGNTMHLQVIPENKRIQPFSFSLTKGKGGRIVRCH